MIEYKILVFPKKKEQIEEELNSLAKEGWRVHCACGKKGRSVILKRKLIDEEHD